MKSGPDKSRALTAGLIGAAANIGYLLVAVLSMVLLSFIGAMEGAFLSHRPVAGNDRAAAFPLRVAAADDQRRAAGAARFLRDHVRAGIGKVEGGACARGTLRIGRECDLFGVLFGSLATLGIIWAWSPIGLGAAAGHGGHARRAGGSRSSGYLYPVRRYLAPLGSRGIAARRPRRRAS